LMLENLALRQQLVVLKRRHPKSRLGLFDKLFWVALRGLWADWKKCLYLVCSSPKPHVRRNLARFVLVSARKRSLNSVKVCVEECEGLSAGEPGCTRVQRICI
jgi:hypothetical protein